jgi:P27 family predicted phage terminase small subunit
MATRGRKPTPLHLVAARGNPRQKKLPDLDKAVRPPELDQPMPPAHLSDEAKVEWGRLIATMCTLHLMTTLDVAAFAAYCQAYGRWVQAERAAAAMAEKDPVNRALMIKTTGGNAIQNPLIGIANKAMQDMLRAATEFGMTPSARARVQGDAGGANTGNPFDAFRKSGT